MTLIDKAEPHDDDLIRRGDALAAVQGLEYSCNAEEDIAAIPAVTVRVKPLVWRDEFMRWSGNSFTSTAVGAGHTYISAASLDDPEADNVIAAKKAAAQADYEARILAALEPVAAPDPALRPTMTDMMVDPDTLDAFMEANPLPPDPAAIREAALYEALTDVLDAIGALSKPHELEGYGMSQNDIDRIFALIHKPQSGIEKGADR